MWGYIMLQNKKKTIIILIVSVFVIGVGGFVALFFSNKNNETDENTTDQSNIEIASSDDAQEEVLETSETSEEQAILETDIKLLDNPTEFIEEDWKLAYYNKLEEQREYNLECDEIFKIGTDEEVENAHRNYVYSYMLYDIDDDGVPELIMNKATSESQRSIDVYTYKNNELVLVGNSGAGHREYFGNIYGGGMVSRWCHFGSEAVSITTIENGALVGEELYASQITADTPSSGMDRVIEGTYSLDVYDIEYNLPLIEYGQDGTGRLQTLYSEKLDDDLVIEKLTDTIENNGMIYTVCVDNQQEEAYIHFNELRTVGFSIDKDEEVTVCDYEFIDVDGFDGQLECVVTVNDENKVILSLQNDIVYAYYLSSHEYGMLSGNTFVDLYSVHRYSFYLNECYKIKDKDYTNILYEIRTAEFYVQDVLTATGTEELTVSTFSEEGLPKYIKIVDVCCGDIQNDGTEEVAVVFEYTGNRENNIYYPYAYGDRIISVCKPAENSWFYGGRNLLLIKDASQGGMSGDPYKNISIEDGKLKVSDCGGDADRWGNEWYFEYINSRLSLEKYICYEYNTNTKNGVAEEYYLEDGYAYRYSIDMNEEDYAPIIISDATFEAEVVKFEETGGEYRIVEFPNVIADANFVGTWNRTGVHSGRKAIVEITNQDETGFDFSGEFCHFSHIGSLEGRAYFSEDGIACYEYVSDIEGQENQYVYFTMTEDGVYIYATGDSGALGFGMNVTVNGEYTTEVPVYTNATVLEDNFTEEELESIKAVVTEEYYEDYFLFVVESGTMEIAPCELSDGTKAVYYYGFIPTMGDYNFTMLKCENGDIYYHNYTVGWKTNVSGAIDFPAYTLDE